MLYRQVRHEIGPARESKVERHLSRPARSMGCLSHGIVSREAVIEGDAGLSAETQSPEAQRTRSEDARSRPPPRLDLGGNEAAIGRNSRHRAVTFTVRPIRRALAHKP